MDAYNILGVKHDASTEEINAAFKALAEKYSEDKYADGPLSELAAKKRKEIENAYDEIIKSRAAAKNNSQANTGSAGTYSYVNTNPEYREIRELINNGDINSAAQRLQSYKTKDAEWFYLNGLVALRKGMYNEAFYSFKTAVNKEPSNEEYKAAYMRMQQQASGYRGAGSASADAAQCCNCCNSLICADCCCECMGGDLIPCC